MTPVPISLAPLILQHHVQALQALYEAAPGYWTLYEWPNAPAQQAEEDLRAAAATPGRTIMGILRRLQASNAAAGAELIGMIDFRLHWPGDRVVYIGMMLVAEPLQRQGIGTQAWRLLAPWLAEQAGMHRARLAVQQFNPGALQFFMTLGFHLTGQTDRYRIGDTFVRLLYMEQEWSQPIAKPDRQTGASGNDGDPGS